MTSRFELAIRCLEYERMKNIEYLKSSQATLDNHKAEVDAFTKGVLEDTEVISKIDKELAMLRKLESDANANPT